MLVMVYPWDGKVYGGESNTNGVSKISKIKPDGIAGILYRYLKLGQYVSIIPFDIVPTSDGYQCVPLTGLKKVIIIIMNLVLDLSVLFKMCMAFSGASSNGATQIGSFVSKMIACVWTLYYFIIKYVVYTKRSKFEATLQRLYTLQTKLATEFRAKPPSKLTVRITTVVFITYVLAQAVTQSAIVIYQLSTKMQTLTDSKEISWQLTQGVTDAIFNFPEAVAFQLCLLSAVVVWMLVKMFMDQLRQVTESVLSSKAQEQLVDICMEMLDFSEALEDAMGLYVFAFCFTLLPYYSVQLVRAFTKNWMDRVEIIWCIISYIASLCVSADGNAMLKDFGSYLLMSPSETVTTVTETKEEIEEQIVQTDRLRILLHRISNNGYGIKGKAFTITYGFVGNLAGLILTYSIIVIQFQGAVA